MSKKKHHRHKHHGERRPGGRSGVYGLGYGISAYGYASGNLSNMQFGATPTDSGMMTTVGDGGGAVGSDGSSGSF